MFYRLSLVLLACCWMSCKGPAPVETKELTASPPQSAGFSPERLSRLDSAMSNWVKQEWVNGSVALIARNGKIVFHKAYGYNDPATRQPLDKGGIFRIASQTKAITSVAVMMLWEEGKFALEDPVSKYIPSFANQTVLDTYSPKDTTYTTVPVSRPVTIRDLLTHTSGIGYAAIGSPEETAIYAKYDVPAGLGVTNQKLSDAMTRLGTLPLFHQPGEKWLYGLNTDLLGYLVEIWSDQTLEEFFTSRIFEPLGMDDTYFNVPPEKASRLLNFFQEDSSGIKKQEKTFGGFLDMNFPLREHTYFSGGGGLSSTAYDYAVFLQMLLNEGEYNDVRLLTPNTVRLMITNQIGDLFVGEDDKFGFGFSLVTEEGSRNTPSRPGTFAWGGAFSTTYWVDPEEELVVLLYRQMWGSHISDIDKAFKPLVYQAMEGGE